MKPFKFGPPPQPGPNYLAAFRQWASSLIAEMQSVSLENDTPVRHRYTINDLSTNTLRTLSNTSTTFADLRSFVLTMADDMKKRGWLS